MFQSRIGAVVLLVLLVGCASGTPTTPASPTASPAPSASPSSSPEVYRAVLSGDAEVPPVTTAASGTATATPSSDGKQITFNAQITGLSGPITHALVLEAPAGQTGEVVKALIVSGNSVSGVWSAADAGRPLGASDLDALRNHGLYLEIRTDAHPGGELRGQL
ncbi:MAG TPA: CHRD domain-containing protein [Oscillatoriaceae cyanobacterium]